MKLLLDTCTFVWLAGDSPLLSPRASAFIADPSNQVFLSSTSAWEICIKYALGKMPLPESPEQLIPTERTLRGIETLHFDEESALQAPRLPRLHRDPFDRMLVCQAIAGGLAIVTPDPLIAQYPIRTIW